MKPISQQFYELFRGSDFAHGKYDVKGIDEKKGKVKGDARTIKGPVTNEIWEQHLTGEQGLGVIPIHADGCYFGAIDIDDYSVTIEEIEKRLVQHNIPAVPCRSKSGGTHVYVFMREVTGPSILIAKLTEWAGLVGYPKAEIFPKQTTTTEAAPGNWINMPYFNVEDTTRYAIFADKNLNAEEFLARAHRLQLPKSFLENDFADCPPCIEHHVKVGFPSGSMNKALMNFGVLAFKKFPNNYKEKVAEYNQKYMGPGSRAEVQRAIKYGEDQKYTYACTDDPMVRICDKAMRQVCYTRRYGMSPPATGITTDEDLAIYLPKRIIKYDSDPPIWKFIVTDPRTEQDVAVKVEGEIDAFRIYKKAYINRLNFVPPPIKATVWINHINTLLQSALEVIEAPDERGAAGAIVDLLHDFINQREEFEKSALLQAQVYTDTKKKRHYFRGKDFLRFLSDEKASFKDRDVWEAIKDHADGKPRTVQISGKGHRCWTVEEIERHEVDNNVTKIEREY